MTWTCRRPGAAGQGPDPAGREADRGAGIGAALKRARRRDITAGPRRSWRRCAAPSWASRRPSPPPTPSRPVPGRGDHRPERAGQRPAGQVEADFGRHPDAEIYRSQPGLGAVLGARVLGEFGDDPTGTPSPRLARTTPAPPPSPARRARRRSSLARYIRNDRLADALMAQALTPWSSPGARAYYDASAPAASATTPPYASSATVSSASSTAASKPAPSTTRHRLAAPRHDPSICHRRLTSQPLGCLFRPDTYAQLARIERALCVAAGRCC